MRIGLRSFTYFHAIFLSSLAVVLGRMASPLYLDWDGSVQWEAAQRFLAGHGLTSTYFIANHVGTPGDIEYWPEAKRLVWYPPGFSLLIALFESWGMSLVYAVKSLYAIAAVGGWMGWAWVLTRAWGNAEAHLERVTRILLLSVAAVLPFAFTPAFTATNIFLWAGLPYFVRYLDRREHFRAGLLVGLLWLFRYHSVFLLPTAWAVVYLRDPLGFRTKRGAFVRPLLGFAFLAVPNWVVNKLYGPVASGLPDFISGRLAETGFFSRVEEIVGQFPEALRTLGIPGLAETPLAPRSFVASVIITLGLLAITSFLVWRYRNRPVVGTLVVGWLALVLFLAALTGLEAHQGLVFVGEPRYFIPVNLVAIVVFIHAAIRTGSKMRVRIGKMAVFAIFVFHFGLAPAEPETKIGESELENGSVINGAIFFVNRVTNPRSLSSPRPVSKPVVDRLRDENPGAVFFIEDIPFYLYDGKQGYRWIPDAKYFETLGTFTTTVFWVGSGECTTSSTPSPYQARRKLLESRALKSVIIEKFCQTEDTYIARMN